MPQTPTGPHNSPDYPINFSPFFLFFFLKSVVARCTKFVLLWRYVGFSLVIYTGSSSYQDYSSLNHSEREASRVRAA